MQGTRPCVAHLEAEDTQLLASCKECMALDARLDAHFILL